MLAPYPRNTIVGYGGGFGCPVSEAGWFDLDDIIRSWYGGEQFRDMGDVLSIALCGKETDKMRIQIAVVMDKESNKIIDHKLIRAIVGHSIPGIRTEKTAAPFIEQTLPWCVWLCSIERPGMLF